MELDRFEEAASYYSKASNYMPNKYFTPAYLMKEALAYEKLNQNEKAIAAYDRIITEFFDSPEFTNAKKYKARLQKN
jgi:TolA-binding protein